MRLRSTFRLSVVYEYAARDEHLMGPLVAALSTRIPGLRTTVIGGLFPTYRQGGLRFERLVNLVWVYLRTAVHLLLCRPDAVLVHTSPPGIQLWTVAWASIGRVPVICWFMDYHPEIEARGMEKRNHRRTAALLRAIDARLMPRFAAIITLDQAMASLVRRRAPQADIVEHPTWTLSPLPEARPARHPPGSGDGPLKLVYTGNLGVAHDLEPLARLLAAIRGRRPVSVLTIGTSAAGEERFREMGAQVGAEVEHHPRVPLFADLGILYGEREIDAGIVVLSEDLAGLVSPSKFVGYIDFGLPLVYMGPTGTNSARVCESFGGGFWIPPGASASEIDKVASSLLDPRQMDDAASGALAAARSFHGFGAETLADRLAPRLELAASETRG